MSKTWNYTPGDWWAICDVCSKKVKASKMKKRWDGLMVCDKDFEPRHSQDFLRTRSDKISVPFTRPRPTDVFVSVTYDSTTYTCGPNSVYAIAGEALAGCVIAGKINPGLL